MGSFVEGGMDLQGGRKKLWSVLVVMPSVEMAVLNTLISGKK